MSGVRVLVGTRKGAFVLTADGRRDDWRVEGPHFAGWEVYHVAGSPADPDRVWAAPGGGWFGQVVQRSDDGGRTWEPVDSDFRYETSDSGGDPGTHQYYDGTPKPFSFTRLWHLEPSATDPDTVWAGAEDAALFRTADGGRSWAELPALRRHPTAPAWSPGAGGMCLHTVLLHPDDPQRMLVAISAAGVFATDDGGQSWRPSNSGLVSEGIPEASAEVGHCVHRLSRHPARPETIFMQKHWDVMRSDDGGGTWREISGDLPTDFGFPVQVHAHEPETVYVVPITSDSLHVPPDGRLRGLPQPDRWRGVGAADAGPAAGALLRQRPARRDGRGLPRALRRVRRHDRWAGVRLRRRRRLVDTAGARPARRAVGGGADPAVTETRASADPAPPARVRVVLPAHLRALARVQGEVGLAVAGPVTTAAVLDALEAELPVLRGRIRDTVTARRRAFVRYYACSEDLSHDPPDAPLPEAVAAGQEPFLVVGAMAGG